MLQPTYLKLYQKSWFGISILILLTIIAYSPLWQASFAWDDVALIADNSLTKDLSNIKSILKADLWETTRLPAPESGYYRPLFLLSLAFERAFYGLSPQWHHFHSLIWHLASVITLYTLIKKSTGNLIAPTLVATAIMALHPVQSETVALIAARNDSMAATFLLLGLLLFQSAGPPKPIRAIAALLAFFLALCSKESAVLAPFLLLSQDLAVHKKVGSYTRYIIIGLSVTIYIGARIWAGVGSAALPDINGLKTLLTSLPSFLGVYSSLIVWPWPLTPARHINYLPNFSSVLPGMLFLIGLIALGFKYGRDRRLFLSGLTFALLTFAPTLVATLDKGLLGERYLYLPMAGISIMVAAALPKSNKILALSTPILAAFITVLQIRLPQWKDSRSLWEAANKSAPSPLTQGGLAWYVNQDGDYQEALDLVVKAIEGEPPYYDACPYLVTIPLSLKQPKKAIELGLWGLKERNCPETTIYMNSLAVALATTSHWDEAVTIAKNLPGQAGFLILGADAVRKGNSQELSRLARSWYSGSDDYVRRVEKLLRLSGIKEPLK